ncbi:uncharacterized protein LOC130443225 [Diorhabda sublineata]|uniref:uncharacterized protein LOC130443225 n=1 Tax=Diorhabda sublineata TaxID=1163346 RepID=UPI0024E109A3|nr:uncharacterized protein LOC130443225 [Diorhabda sublineata]
MKLFQISISISVLLFTSFPSYGTTDEINTNTNCVKVYYNEEGFYKIYCFTKSSIYKHSYGIITDKNDTVIFTGNRRHSQCFDVFQFQSGKTTSSCITVVAENCIKTEKNINDVDGVPCKIESTIDLQLGLKVDNLNIVFKCKIVEEVRDSAHTIPTKLCHNIPWDFEEEGREETYDNDVSQDLEGIIVDIPPRFPKRE